jgi:type II secretory pathway component PulK
VPHALTADAIQADQDVAKTTEAAADEAYKQQVLAYSEAHDPYRDSLVSFTQWCDDDARAPAVLS